MHGSAVVNAADSDTRPPLSTVRLQRRKPPPVVAEMATEAPESEVNAQASPSTSADSPASIQQESDNTSSTKLDDEKGAASGQAPSSKEINGSSSSAPTELANVGSNVNGTSKPRELAPDDPHAMVIESLRSQISDLISQVTQLNGKLVKSYDRVSDLEDELHYTSQNLRQSSIKVSQLELERTQHLAALNTGLLVEKAHVTSELNRLMERATEEAARRGQAESARTTIEKELDDLSANLFDQANTMVAEARFQRAISERKVEESENALRGAEEAVSMMQIQMQTLRDEKEKSDQEATRLKGLMGKGKFIENAPPTYASVTLRLLSLHSPYQEFLLFVAHLRSVRPATPQPPPITTFLPLPFLSRMQTEDSDPTLRLDFAPSLNWLSRRSVLAAIQAGQLTIEPMSFTTLLLESTSSSLQSMIPGSHHTIQCALCGAAIAPSSEHESRYSSRHNSSQWTGSLFRNALSVSSAPSPPLTPPHANTYGQENSPSQPQHVYIFRLPPTQANSITAQGQQRLTNYPLCLSGWCLSRLRTTCTLWAFIRTSVIDKVWEEEVPELVTPTSASLKGESSNKLATPPVPPRRRSKMSNLWGMASGALSSVTQSPKKPDSTPSPKAGSFDEKKDVSPSVPLVPHRILAPPPPKRPVINTSAPPPLPRRSAERQSPSKEGSPAVNPVELPGDSSGTKRTTRSGSDAGSTPTITKESPRDELPKNADGEPVSAQNGIVASNSGSTTMSKDEFTTPVEELSSLPIHSQPSPIPPVEDPRESPLSRPTTPVPIKRISLPTAPLSPRAIPLPDSRPGSPAAIAARSRPTSVQLPPIASLTDEANKLSRPSTPSPGVAAPPVPRRAAARRPVPAPPPSGPQVRLSVSPETPLVGLPSRSGVNEKDESGEGQEKVEQDTVPLVSGKDSKEEKPAEPAAAEKSTQEYTLPPPPLPPRRPSAEASRPSMERLVPPPVAMATSIGSDKTVYSQASDDDNAHGPFIGEATWEERTWKELVRLREDMFWARIGAAR